MAIVGSDGQLRLKGDVHAQDSDTQGKAKDPTALPPKPSRNSPDSLFSVLSTSQIAADGSNLLLYRPLNGPIFSISPSGEVQVHRLKVQGHYRLFTIKATGGSWIIELLRELPSRRHGDEEFAMFAFDPESRSPLRHYLFHQDLGWGLACAYGDELTFLMANPETNTLGLVTLSSRAKP